MTDLTQRLEAAIKKRNMLEAQVQRVQGKLEATQKSLAAVEEECTRKGVDPSKLDDTIADLTRRLTEELAKFEQDLARAEEALSPYTGD